MKLQSVEQIKDAVRRSVNETPILDIHTHIYPANFGALLLWGIDELLTYHYLVAEVFRVVPQQITYEQFWSMSKTEQADLIWQKLFIERSPISESCRGVLTCLNLLGVDSSDRDLGRIRKFFAEYTAERYVDRVVELSNVRGIIMTNNPFDPEEHPCWMDGRLADDRFQAVLRLDDILVTLPKSVDQLKQWGYEVAPDLSGNSAEQLRCYLRDWLKRMNATYLAVSLPPTFDPAGENLTARVLKQCVLPTAAEAGRPMALMIGVKKLLNPHLQLAGDSVGKADIGAVEYLCKEFPQNKFLVTMLSRENQHELCVTARKFGNLHVFGCWWFMNNPSIVDEITRERIELLGLSVTPQHSDARVLDQLVYKWSHSRKVIADVLTDKYADLAQTGWVIDSNEIQRDVELLLGAEFERFLAG